MSREEAFQILDQVTSQVALKREDHVKLSEAMQILANLVFPVRSENENS